MLCDTPGVIADPVLLVERNVAEWLRAQAVVPGVELHDDPDVTWVVHPGRVWSNAGVMIRMTKRSAPSRLDTLVERYRAHQRGMGLWVSPLATPETLPDLLKARSLRCRNASPRCCGTSRCAAADTGAIRHYYSRRHGRGAV